VLFLFCQSGKGKEVIFIVSLQENINEVAYRVLLLHFIDSPMGKGKSQAIINYANSGMFDDESSKRLLIIVPTKAEQDRFVNNCHGFTKPKKTPFRQSVKELLKEGRNIITTHALCVLFDDEVREILANGEYRYTLVIDEQPNCIRDIVRAVPKNYQDGDGSPIPLIEYFSRKDIQIAEKQGMITVDKMTNRISWVNSCQYDNGVYMSLKHYTEIADLYNFGTSKDGNINTIIALIKKELFLAFTEVFICSYMLKGSLLENYCDYYHLAYDYYHVENFNFTKGYQFEYPRGLERLSIVMDKSLLTEKTLSKYAFANDKKFNKGTLVKTLACKFRSFREKYKVKTDKLIFTTFKDYQKDLCANRKYVPKSCYLPCNTKATNEYRESLFVGYLCNRFFNQNMVNFMRLNGIAFDDDLFALSELLQFIWRSNIRVTDSDSIITVYVPDKRMRKLLVEFIHNGLAEQNVIGQVA
jgi:hypothetical protein